MARLRSQRERFWLEDPHCYLCGRFTYLLLNTPPDKLPPQSRDRLATIDHERARHHPDRRKPGGNHYLACYSCNNNRDKEELATRLDWQRTSSAAFPINNQPLDKLIKAMSALSLIKPRGRKNKQSIKQSQEKVIWELWERGFIED